MFTGNTKTQKRYAVIILTDIMAAVSSRLSPPHIHMRMIQPPKKPTLARMTYRQQAEGHGAHELEHGDRLGRHGVSAEL